MTKEELRAQVDKIVESAFSSVGEQPSPVELEAMVVDGLLHPIARLTDMFEAKAESGTSSNKG